MLADILKVHNLDQVDLNQYSYFQNESIQTFSDVTVFLTNNFSSFPSNLYRALDLNDFDQCQGTQGMYRPSQQNVEYMKLACSAAKALGKSEAADLIKFNIEAAPKYILNDAKRFAEANTVEDIQGLLDNWGDPDNESLLESYSSFWREKAREDSEWSDDSFEMIQNIVDLNISVATKISEYVTILYVSLYCLHDLSDTSDINPPYTYYKELAKTMTGAANQVLLDTFDPIVKDMLVS